MFAAGTPVSTSATCTEDTADQSGWIIWHALVVKQTIPSVDMQDGENTTVFTPRMLQYRALFHLGLH